jgi:hypothetical protein
MIPAVGCTEFLSGTAVIFEETDSAEACDQRVGELRLECFRNAEREFHFNKCCDDYRDRFLAGIRGYDFFYLAFVLNKERLYGPGFAYKEPF